VTSRVTVPTTAQAPIQGRIALTRASIQNASGWRRAAIAFGAGAASVLALAPFYVWPVMFLTLPVLIWLIDDGTARHQILSKAAVKQSFLAGWLFGFGYFAAGLFWIGEAFLVEADKLGWLLPFAVTLLPAGLALFWGAATAAAASVWKPDVSRIVVLAVALGSVEWLRGHVFTGFPWNLLGYTLTSSDALMQSAALVGTYSLAFWAVLIFATPLVALADNNSGTTTTLIATTAAPLMIAALFGASQLTAPPPDVAGVKLRIVQPSIPQREKWLAEKQGLNFQRHLDLSKTSPNGTPGSLDGITHIIWPEAAMPFRPLDHPEALSAISDMLGQKTYLLAGALRVKQDPNGRSQQAYNSLIVFGPGGGPTSIYDKIHLVPFGEYLPWPWLLEQLGFEDIVKMRGGFAAGSTPRTNLDVPGLPPAVSLICYEAIFPGEAIQSAPRPALILTVTNDGWFGNTTGPRQHLHQARVRAVEEGLPVIRAANNGISAVIDAKGRLRARLDMNIHGTIDSDLPAAVPAPLYARFGDWIFVLHLCIFAAVAWLLRTRQPLVAS
jgi:apolipoprotein N-acyltransferase